MTPSNDDAMPLQPIRSKDRRHVIDDVIIKHLPGDVVDDDAAAITEIIMTQDKILKSVCASDSQQT